MTVSISELQIEYAQYPKPPEEGPGRFVNYGGHPGTVRIDQSGLVLEAPRPLLTPNEARTKIRVSPENIDSLILALQRARDLGRQMFNSEVAP